MFTKPIETRIHPATWAVLALRTDEDGNESVTPRGTGFAVDAEGHILTCWHVGFWDNDRNPADRFVVVQPEIDIDRRLPARLVAAEEDCDLALLRIEGDDTRTTAAQLHAGPRIPWGRSCCAFGHPLSVVSGNNIRIFTRSGAGIVSTPMLSPLSAGKRPVSLYEVDFFTHGGMSGGPLFLANGCVFGIVHASRMLPDGNGDHSVRSNLSVTIDIAEAIQFLKPLGVKLQLAGHVGRDVVSKKSNRHRSSKRTKKRKK